MAKITKNTTLAGILALPGAEKVLAKYNLPCLWCPLVKFEIENLKLGQVCKIYNIDVEKLLKELNPLTKFGVGVNEKVEIECKKSRARKKK